MKLEEYILKRKQEDGINEFDADKRSENVWIYVNYVFEYFNNYLETEPADEKTILHEQKVEKYKKMIRDYDAEVKDWLVSLYLTHGKYMHKQLDNEKEHMLDDSPLTKEKVAELKASAEEILIELEIANKQQETAITVPATAWATWPKVIWHKQQIWRHVAMVMTIPPPLFFPATSACSGRTAMRVI